MKEASRMESLLAAMPLEMKALERDQLKKELSRLVNQLILEDFERLIGILYRMDVPETKLKALLQQNQNTDASLIIAELMVSRQEQKLRSRKEQGRKDDIWEEERW